MLTLHAVRTNNLKKLSLAIDPLAVTAVCGVSGSGKTSLVFDTIHAESQRRYLETFSPKVREQLARLPRADCERIDHLPPTIAIPQDAGPLDARSTVGDESDLLDLLAIALERDGIAHCPQCGKALVQSTAEGVASEVAALDAGTRVLVGFPIDGTPAEAFPLLQAARLARAVVGTELVRLDDPLPAADASVFGVVDRVVSGKTKTTRLIESCEVAFAGGRGRLALFRQDDDGWQPTVRSQSLACPAGHIDTAPLAAADFLGRTPRSLCEACQGDACDACNGTGRSRLVRNVFWIGRTFGDWLTIPLSAWPEAIELGPEAVERLQFLRRGGLGSLSLHRRLATLSAGQLQRLRLARLATAGLVGTLVILDEPTAGLQDDDCDAIRDLIQRLHADGNGVLLIEHRLPMLAIASRVLELGPAAGAAGGEIVFDGSPDDLPAADTPTGHALRTPPSPVKPSPPEQTTVVDGLRLTDDVPASLNLAIDRLTVVTGSSGSGKTRLLHGLAAAFGKPQSPLPLDEPTANEPDSDAPPELDVRVDAASQFALLPPELIGTPSVVGNSPIEDTVVVDRSPASNTMRSSVATASKAFDEIRAVLASVPDAKARGLTARHFSYNAPGGGRCNRCRGRGTVTVAMAHLADLPMDCPRCQGTRYEADILAVKYRRRNIAETLAMTIDEALVFFRTEVSIHRRLQPFKDAGLGYLTLGRALPTLSGGEAQRLRLATHLTATTRGRVLFLLDEPARGLHPHDAATLADSLRRLLEIGHTVVAVDSSSAIVAAADVRIEVADGQLRNV